MKKKDRPPTKGTKAAAKKHPAKGKARDAASNSSKTKPQRSSAKSEKVKCPFCGTHALLPPDRPLIQPRVRPLMMDAGAAGEAVAAGPAADTRGRIREIIVRYGMVAPVTNSTNIGQSVPSMQRFTGDVNAKFRKHYDGTQLQPAWSINQTSVFVDSH